MSLDIFEENLHSVLRIVAPVTMSVNTGARRESDICQCDCNVCECELELACHFYLAQAVF